LVNLPNFGGKPEQNEDCGCLCQAMAVSLAFFGQKKRAEVAFRPFVLE
jgi:hypothetical protein